MNELVPHKPDDASNGDTPQRDEAGKFLPGCRPGPGNRGVVRMRLKQALKDEDVEACARVLREIRDNANARDRDRLTAISIQLEFLERVKAPADVVAELAEMRETLEVMQADRLRLERT